MSGGRPGGIDRLVHEPARMALLSLLEGVEGADFLFLQRALDLTQGNLSSHLAKLEGGGLVEVVKSYRGKIPLTTVAITTAGRAAAAEHWAQMQALRALATPAPARAAPTRAQAPYTAMPGPAGAALA